MAASTIPAVVSYDEYGEDFTLPAPCQQGCPVGTDIPSYVGLVWQGDLPGAYEVISEQNPFSSICGRVCSKPCESQCRRGESDGAVAIRGLKRFVTERVAPGVKPEPVPVTREKTVGIVGGGPAGLTAAKDLAEAGYGVHIYEKSGALGGMMSWGIPSFRLPRSFVEEDIRRLLERCPGIKVHLNCALGDGVSLDDLKQRHDAVLLAVGLWRDRDLGVPGEEDGLEGLYGIRFLTDINRGMPVKLNGRVVVVGGGNVAMDVARTARRAGAEEVRLYCLEGRDEMPAWEHEIGEALAEGVSIHNGWGPKEIRHDDREVTGIEFMRCTAVFDEEGRFNPQYDPKVTEEVEATAILVSIGLAAENAEIERLGLIERDRVRADFETMRTADPKVFAAGDGAFGPSSVVYAVHHGHRAAHYMKAHLEGIENPEPYAVPYRVRRVPLAQDPNWETLPREEGVFLGLGEKPCLDAECSLTFDLETARRQAARCLRCDAETGTAGYSRRTREHIHIMARTQPGDVTRLQPLLSSRLKPRENPFPPDRPAHLDDLVFLPAALTRLVIDPYREHCSTATRLGENLQLAQPFLFTGFDEAPEEVRAALAAALAKCGCGYVGTRPLPAGPGAGVGAAGGDGKTGNGKVPWLQVFVPGTGEPDASADGVVAVLGRTFRPVELTRLREGQLLGLAVGTAALPEAIPYALERGFDLLLLDGTEGIEKPWPELSGSPDLTVLRDAIAILRRMNREEEITLLYFGGLRSGTDVAKVLAFNGQVGVFGAAMALAVGGVIENGRLHYSGVMQSDERSAAAVNWIKATVQETAIIARCTGKTNVHNLEPEDMRTLTLATREATDIPLASGRPPREYF